MYAKENTIYWDDQLVVQHQFQDERQTAMRELQLLVCYQGHMRIMVYDQELEVTPSHILFMPQGSHPRDAMYSGDYDGLFISMSAVFFQHTFGMNRVLSGLMDLLTRQPLQQVEPLSEDGKKFFRRTLYNNDNPFHREEIHTMIRLLVYSTLGPLAASLHREEHEGAMTQGDMLFHRFMDLVRQNSQQKHTVQFYADQLFVTPKHLSAVCREHMGKNASTIISDALTSHIRYLLLHSDLTIKEIAAKTAFPNLSFFGRYVVKHLGDNPTNIRNSHIS